MDAVLSEDVDTLMFGSGVTLRSWTPEGNSGKTPTHVNVYRAEETLASSKLDGQGMVLVALMSGGDYIPEGIPGCGPKVACDAARAGFGKELCALRRSDKEGLRQWRERLQHEIRTNESKFFSRKNKNLALPDDFPSAEVLGYYTRPCISTPQKLEQLRETLKWDQSIDFPALRSFTGDAFDWRCIIGAKKFIRNLAPAMLVRRLRLIAEADQELEQEAQAAMEAELVTKVHGKRNHYTAGGELELRISFTPSKLVPIDLSIEDEEDDFVPAGQDADDSDPEEAQSRNETPTETSDAEEAPASPTKKTRQVRPYDPDAPEKLWILKDFLQLGCPLLVEDYEAALRNPREALKARRKAATNHASIHAPAPKPRTRGPRSKANKSNDIPENALMRHMRVTKAASVEPEMLANKGKEDQAGPANDTTSSISGFKMPSIQVPRGMLRKSVFEPQPEEDMPAVSRHRKPTNQSTPKRSNRLKRPSADLSTPRVGRARADITSYFSPTPRAKRTQSQGPAQAEKRPEAAVIDLLSSSPMQDTPRDPSPTPGRRTKGAEDDLLPLPSTVTKRRKTRRGPLRKSSSAPVGVGSAPFVSRDGSPKLDGFMVAEEAELETRMSPTPNPAENLQPKPQPWQPPPDFQSSNSLPTPPAETTSPDPKFRARQDTLPRPTTQSHPSRIEEPILLSSSSSPDPLPPVLPRRHNPKPRLSAPAPGNSPPRPTSIPDRNPATEPSNQSISAPAPREEPLQPQPEQQQQQQQRKNPKKKTHILLRTSLPGTWRAAMEDEAEALDLTGDGSGVRAEFGGRDTSSSSLSRVGGKDSDQRGQRGGRARSKWRVSGVEVLDLTGTGGL